MVACSKNLIAGSFFLLWGSQAARMSVPVGLHIDPACGPRQQPSMVTVNMARGWGFDSHGPLGFVRLLIPAPTLTAPVPFGPRRRGLDLCPHLPSASQPAAHRLPAGPGGGGRPCLLCVCSTCRSPKRLPACLHAMLARGGK